MAKSEVPMEDYDAVIIGGGLVGASLGVALKPSNKKVLVVEPVAHDSQIQPSYDERTVALTHSAKLIFGAMGVWQEIASTQVEKILDIHISNRGSFGQTHLSHKHAGTEALGYVVPTRVIGNVLWEKLSQDKKIDLFCPATAESLEQVAEYCVVNINQKGNKHLVRTKLVVLADGGRSEIGKQIFQGAKTIDYGQSAILSIVTVDRPHNGRAYERFTDEGPLALLPHNHSQGYTPGQGNVPHQYAVVWTTDQKNTDTKLEYSDEHFLAELQSTFGDRAGNFSNPSPRKCYPLTRSTLDNLSNGRVIAIGNAAHTVHPVAGQGFNLGLRDVANLAEIIFDLKKQGIEIGNQSMIDKYIASRKHDTRIVSEFTHSLVEVFSSDLKALGFLRNFGLKTIELFPPAKRFLLKRTMGLAGKQSKLALGIPLG